MSYTKISIIGAGAVGATTAYALILRNIVAEVTLIDIDEKRCEGEILDLSDAISFSVASKIKRGTIEDTKDSKIIIICAGARQKPGQKREDLLEINKVIVQSIIKQLNPIRSDAIIVIITNPVDIMAYYAQKISDLPKNQVFGTGTFLDTQRIRRILAQKLNIADQSIHAYILGEHGDSQFVAWSSASIAGKPILEFPGINKELLTKLSHEAQQKVYEIIKCKGATYFGIAACISAICENIIFDQKYVLPLSIYNKDFDVCISVPVVLGIKGIEKVIIPHLNTEEQILFKKSAEKLKAIIKAEK